MNKLLLPGIRMKRWILVFLLGAFLFMIALFVAFGPYVYNTFKAFDSWFVSLLGLSADNYTGKIIYITLLAIIGLGLIFFSVTVAGKRLIDTLLPEKRGRIYHFLYKTSQLNEGANVVVIGGGTGLSTMLKGLKNETNNISAIVSVSDAGGSSKTMRDEFKMLPPGDIRHCMVALSDASPEMAKMFEYRFKEGKQLKGHSLGNLIITGMTRITGDFAKAVDELSKIFAIRGRVLPVSLDKNHLCAELENGKRIQTEPEIEIHKTKYKSEIKRIYLKPKASAYPEAVKALKRADIIVLGPGSLYTSIIPNLLVEGIPEAINKSKGKVVYVCNVMTQPGETDDYKASDHVMKIVKYLGEGVLDFILVNKTRAPEQLYRKYRSKGSKRVKIDQDKLWEANADVVEADLMMTENLLHHDHVKLAKEILSLK